MFVDLGARETGRKDVAHLPMTHRSESHSQVDLCSPMEQSSSTIKIECSRGKVPYFCLGQTPVSEMGCVIDKSVGDTCT